MVFKALQNLIEHWAFKIQKILTKPFRLRKQHGIAIKRIRLQHKTQLIVKMQLKQITIGMEAEKNGL